MFVEVTISTALGGGRSYWDATGVAADVRIAGSSTTPDLLGQAPVTTPWAVRHAWTGQNWGWGGSPV